MKISLRGGGIDSLVKSIESLETELDYTILFESLESPAALPPQSIETLPYNDKIEFLQALQTPLNLNALLDSIPTPPQKGWERVRLKSVIADIDTQSQIPSEKEFFYIGLENIQKGGKKFEIVKATPKEVISNSLIIKKGYVYYSKLRPYLKKIFYSDRDEKVYASSELVGLKFSNYMNANLMLHILLSDFITKQEINTKGLRMPRIGIDEIQNFTIFKPPLEAQEKIISAISKVEERINLIDSSLESLEAQKAKILKDILEGNKERERERERTE